MSGTDPDDIVDVLLDQHRRLRELSAQISTARGKDKHRLFAESVAVLHGSEHGSNHK